ncbi:MAG: hypothetical protein IH888_08950 [Planctomycetes bacterium]|nr:hypothetical protein [Planctomycetota bacterium]
MDWVNPQRHPQALLTITDFDGGFVFRDVPATTYWLWAGNARGQAARPRLADFPSNPYKPTQEPPASDRLKVR